MVGQHLRDILGFRLVTADLSRLVAFYRQVLGFSVEGSVHPLGETELALLGVMGPASRQILSIGQQVVAIEQFDVAGQPYPADGDAASLWFQHLAMIVTDIGGVHARLRDVSPISIDGPQHLPASSGGVWAYKFRDPDGHPLELLQFPEGGGPEAWRGRAPLPGQLALGIDHSAISVHDPDASAAFYARLGLRAGERTYNKGSAQERCDDLRDVEVVVVPMMPDGPGPHLELLGYRVPRGASGPALRPNDLAATRIVWKGTGTELLRDPDGHLHQVESSDRSAEA